MNFLLGITPWPVVSALLWIVLAVTSLFFARPTAHRLIRAAGLALQRMFRTASLSVSGAEESLAERNRQVLLAAGREAKERIVEREFDRINETVRRDLANFSVLHRTLSESITRIEEDHADAVDVPPDPPGWVKAVEAVAALDSKDNRVSVGGVLSNIHESMMHAHKEAMSAYRRASRTRHTLLRKMRPEWRRIQQTIDKVGKNVDSLLGRSATIDRHMQEYEDMVKGEDRAVSILSSSSLVYFFVSALVLAVAVGGATINFSLIARPMAEMVGGTNLIGGFKTADIAALVIILVEISMGLFLMESLRITRLFPVIGALPDKMRVRMIWITFSILFLLASVEAGLAFMREVLLQDELATSALLRGEAIVVANDYMWITTVAQMGMGFILPFALTFVAIPLETFVHSLRTVLGLVAIGALRATATGLRVLSSGSRAASTFAMQVYDLPLFIPLWWTARGKRHGARRRTAQGDTVNRLGLGITACVIAAACSGPVAPSNAGVYMLVDTSGTYQEEIVKAQQIIRYTLSRMDATDTFAVARIDTGSFSEKDIVAKVTFDDRPSTMNQQKRLFAEQVNEFVDESKSSPYTDITGGLLQATEFLNEKGPGRKTVLIFSDLKEDLEEGYIREIDFDLEGFDVIALNVTKLRSDNVDPREYLSRLDAWQNKVETSGGNWRVINDLDGLDGLL